MSISKTIIISCAGMGSRLGMGIPKALLDIDGKPLIIRQLEMLEGFQDIRIVVGYQAEQVIKVVNKYRRDIVYVLNHNYKSTGTGASVSLAMKNSKEYVIVLDGDLLVHPEDMKYFLETSNQCIGGSTISTDDPVLIQTSVQDKRIMAQGFSREEGAYEWTGLAQFRRDEMSEGTGHVYKMLEGLLPLEVVPIRAKEIDTMNDYKNTIQWVENGYESPEAVIGILGGMGSWATMDIFQQVLESFPAQKEWDRPRVIIDNNCTMPSRVRAVLYKENVEELVNKMVESIKNLMNSGANQVFIGCNTAHYFLDAIYERLPESKEVIINIIEVCVEYLQKQQIRKVSLIASEGTLEAGIYQKICSEYSIEIYPPKEEHFLQMRELIESVKQNKVNEVVVEQFKQVLLEQQCEHVILGCTEFPILERYLKNDEIKERIQLINPIELTINTIKNNIVNNDITKINKQNNRSS